MDKISIRVRSSIDTGDIFGLQRGQGLRRHSDSVVASNGMQQAVKMAAMREQRGPGSLLEVLTLPLKNWEKLKAPKKAKGNWQAPPTIVQNK